MAKAINIPININLSITEKTAETCVRLLNLFLENHLDYSTTKTERDGKYAEQIYLVHDPLIRGDEEDE